MPIVRLALVAQAGPGFCLCARILHPLRRALADKREDTQCSLHHGIYHSISASFHLTAGSPAVPIEPNRSNRELHPRISYPVLPTLVAELRPQYGRG